MNILKSLRLLIIFIACGSAVGLAVPAFAQAVEPGAFSSVTDTRSALNAIIAGGASVLASLIIDRVNAFSTLDTGLRMFAVLIFSLVLTTISRLLLQFVPAEVFAAVDVYFRDWLPYIFGASAIFATKSITTGLAKAKTLVALGKSPFNS